MEYQIVSNVADKASMHIDDDMTVGEVRSIIKVMIGAKEEAVMTMAYLGKQINDDEATWSEVMSSLFGKTQQQSSLSGSSSIMRKLYCNVTGKMRLEDGSAEALRAAFPTKEEAKQEERSKRAQARAAEPMIDMMVNNPQLMDSMFASQPALKKMMEENPEVAKQFRNPELMKTMMMSQMDPDRQRDLSRSIQLQLAQISDIPGGQQVLERYMSGFLRDEENAVQRTASDLHAVSEEAALPDPSKEANTEALPNPWARHASPALQGQNNNPFGGMMDAFGGMNPFMGGGGMPGVGASPALPPGMDTAGQMQQMMQMLSGMRQGGAMPSAITNAVPVPPPAAAAASSSSAQAEASTVDDVRQELERSFPQQIQMLRDMGFHDEAMCLRALKSSDGDVEGAVDFIALNQD